MGKYSMKAQKEKAERNKYEKGRYFAHNYKGIAVMGEAFETLAKFKEFVTLHGLQLCYCPMNHASVMTGHNKVVTPQEYEHSL